MLPEPDTDRIATLTGEQVVRFAAFVQSVTDLNGELRVMVQADGVKLQFNRGVWSPGLGEVEER